MVNPSKCLVNGNYEQALMWKPGAPNFRDNRSLAEKNYMVCKKIDKNAELKSKCETVIQEDIF